MNTRNIQFPSNKVRDIERHMMAALSPLYPEGELRQMIRMLFEAFLGWDTVAFMLNRDKTINQSDLLRFHWAMEDLKKHRPIQHIIGYTDFCDCRIEVSPEVLIPRPETEEIVMSIPPVGGAILDLCTGSGCIAIALAHRNPTATVTAVDLSEGALTMARKNALRNEVEINYVQADVLDSEMMDRHFEGQLFHLIVSNPPYVMDKERDQMAANVLDYEPGMALWVADEEPLIFYEAVARFAQKHLVQDGQLVFEINEHLAHETAQMLERYGFQSTLRHDFRDKPRSLICQRG